MTIIELQKILGERINLAINKDRTLIERKTDNEQSFVVAALSKQYINSADVVLRAEKLKAETNKENSLLKNMITG